MDHLNPSSSFPNNHNMEVASRTQATSLSIHPSSRSNSSDLRSRPPPHFHTRSTISHLPSTISPPPIHRAHRRPKSPTQASPKHRLRVPSPQNSALQIRHIYIYIYIYIHEQRNRSLSNKQTEKEKERRGRGIKEKGFMGVI